MIERVVSGGQTGADRAALDVATELGIPAGGWVPAGRTAENGLIPSGYEGLKESDSPNPAVRTRLNVRDSDATLIVSRGPLTGGSRQTIEFARTLGRPHRHVDLARASMDDAVGEVRAWIEAVGPAVLNVAGPRASKDPGIYDLTARLLKSVLEGP